MKQTSLQSSQKDLFPMAEAAFARPEFEDEPFLTIEIPGRIPSWNEILGMEHWERYRFKSKLRREFISGLRVFAQLCSMKTTSARNSILIAAATLESYDRMIRERQRLKSARRRWEKKNPNLFASKSSSNVPF